MRRFLRYAAGVQLLGKKKWSVYVRQEFQINNVTYTFRLQNNLWEHRCKSYPIVHKQKGTLECLWKDQLISTNFDFKVAGFPFSYSVTRCILKYIYIFFAQITWNGHVTWRSWLTVCLISDTALQLILIFGVNTKNYQFNYRLYRSSTGPLNMKFKLNFVYFLIPSYETICI